MIKAIIFDMYETLVTQYSSDIYFGEEIAKDLDVKVEVFMESWRNSKKARTVGLVTFEEIIEKVMKEQNKFSASKFEKIIEKRRNFELIAFANINGTVIPMLKRLKDKGIKIGLITNCFSEEVAPIQQSYLFKMFDATCLSFLDRCQKPDQEIFLLCLERLQVLPKECLYIGDGKDELEKAKELGMRSLQALWYIGNHPENESTRHLDFGGLNCPMDIFNIL